MSAARQRTTRAPWALLALALLAAPSLASAQSVTGVQNLLSHMVKGLPDTQVGDYVTYRVRGGIDERTHYWRVAVVGQDKDKQGRDAYWVELMMGTHHLMRAPLFQSRLLIARNPGPNEEPISRIYIAWGMEKARELSDESLAKLLDPTPDDPAQSLNEEELKLYNQAQAMERQKKLSPAAKKALNIRTLPEKRLMTLAGTVTAVPTEVRYASTVIKRIWMSREVPILHLAKMEIPAIEHSLEVRDYGRNAKPEMILPVDGQPRLSLERGWDSVMIPKEALEEEGAPHEQP